MTEDRTLKGSEKPLWQVGEGRHYVKERKRLRCICFRLDVSSHKSEHVHQDTSESAKRKGIRGNLGSSVVRTTKQQTRKLGRKQQTQNELCFPDWKSVIR